MLESCQDSGSNASLPYGMIITRIQKDIDVDLSNYSVKEISLTYDNRTFSSMGYVFDDGKWYKGRLQAQAQTHSCRKLQWNQF